MAPRTHFGQRKKKRAKKVQWNKLPLNIAKQIQKDAYWLDHYATWKERRDYLERIERQEWWEEEQMRLYGEREERQALDEWME